MQKGPASSSHQNISTGKLLDKLKTGWPNSALALVAGIFVTLSLAPFNIWPLGIVSLTLLAWLLNDLSRKHAAVCGYFYGLGLFGSGISWVYVSIHVYGYAPAPLAATLTILFSAALALLSAFGAYCYVRWIRDKPGGTTVGFAAIFVLGEWLRSWLLTGFPWLYLGYGHIDTMLAGWAPLGGVWAISFAIAYSGAIIAEAVNKKKIVNISLGFGLILWCGGAALNQVDWVTPTDQPSIKVAMVQANISQHVKWSKDHYLSTLKTYRDSSQPLWSNHDIVIWPEGAIPGYYHNAKPFLDDIAKQANLHNSTLITGIPYYQASASMSRGRSYNSIMAVGNGSGIYHKQRLVPFGEYVPLENFLRGLIQFFDLPMSAFSPGDKHQETLQAGPVNIAPFICYEVVYPELIGQWLPRADILLTISNDAWFGESIGPLQHLQMAQMRALEAGRYLLRSTGNGVSAIIDERGHITTQSQQFQAEILSGKATVFAGNTPFGVLGTWPLIIFCIITCLTLQFARNTKL